MNWWVLKRKVHVSWMITFVCIGILIGVFSAQFVSILSQILNTSLVIATGIFLVSLRRNYIYMIPLIIVGGLIIGLWRGSAQRTELAQLKPFYNKAIYFEGTVKDDVDIGSSDQLVIRLGKLTIAGKSMTGVFWVTTDPADIKRGDRLHLHGTLRQGFGNFSGVIYRATIDKVIHPQPGDVARVIRDNFTELIRRVIPEPEASLGIGYLVGQRRALPADLVLALQAAGLTHIVVASGYNLTILVRLARRLFVKISKYLSVLASGVMIVSFIAITGVSPSMSRAGLVAGLSLAAWYYGRKFHPIVLLFLAIAVTLLINPSYAWGDLGWQLSFAAFAGVMIIAPLMQRYLFGTEKPGFIRQILGETISAQIATAPIIIASFGQISNVAIISNLLILPMVPFAMLLTFIAGIGSYAVPFLDKLIALPATWLLDYMVNVAEYLANLPWATSNVQFPWYGVIICYLLVIGTCIYLHRATGFNLRETNLVE